MAGIWIVGGMGAFGVIFSFIVGLMPTGEFSAAETFAYVAGILIGTFLLAVPPLIFLKMKKPSWVEKGGGQA
jgi:hypothetical protein